MAKPLPLMLLLTAQAVAVLALGRAALAAGIDSAEVRRGLALVGAQASDEPALRRERQAREPSADLALGAALGAWVNAAAALDYDLKTPSGDGGDDEAIGVDCYDERTAFAHLEARSQALGLMPPQVVSAAGLSDPQAAAWAARRRTGPPGRCAPKA